MGYVVLNDGGMAAWQEYTARVDEHFQSSTQCEAYLNGLIDWDGNEIEE